MSKTPLRAVACVGSLAWLATHAPAQAPLPSGGTLRSTQSCFDVRHYALDLRVDPAQKSIAGSLTMRADLVEQDVPRIELDLDRHLTVEDVTVDGEFVAHERGEGTIAIPLEGPERGAGDSIEVVVRYGGKPHVARMPPWQGGFTWTETPGGEPWIATSCQGEGGDLFWPCKDHPSDEPDTMTIAIEVPKGLVCATNGTLESKKTVDTHWTRFVWQVRNPINNYGVALNIAPYVEVEDTFESVTGEKVPVTFYALPSSKRSAKKLMPEILDHLKHLEEVCGPYPFRNEKYGVAQTPHLGMEHQTIIAYGYAFQQQPPGYDWLHHHELSHEWWGNLVTCRDWKDMWIHEGIGTYMQALYVESRFGEDAMRDTMRVQRAGLVNRKAVAPRKSQNTHEIYFSTSGNDIYHKGSWITHSLRYVLGDETFFEVLRRWAYPDPELEKVTGGAQTRFTDTEEIREIAEKVAGRDLRWFFDVYLHQPRIPRLSAELDGSELTLSWSTPDDLPFPMPVPVRVGDAMHRVEMQDGTGTLDVGATGAIEIDPLDQILRRGPRPVRR